MSKRLPSRPSRCSARAGRSTWVLGVVLVGLPAVGVVYARFQGAARFAMTLLPVVLPAVTARVVPERCRRRK